MSRREFMKTAATGVLLVACGSTMKSSEGGEKKEGGEDDVTPTEDLMREHGVLRRVMYLYDEATRRFEAHEDVPLDALAGGAQIIRHVIEDYHEKLEENFLFPRFEKAGKLADLTAVLRRQHEKGRDLTAQIMALAKAPLGEPDQAKLIAALKSFNHMYRAHAAREDTVLFPALHSIVGKHEYDEMGEQFEAKETEMLGDHGFEHAVEAVGKLEASFGVDDLAKLTPA